MRSLALAVVLAFGLTGCAAGPGGQSDAQRIVAMGALIALDLDDLKQGGATQAERERFEQHVQSTIALVGLETAVGGELARMLTLWATTGELGEVSWRDAVRMLLEWSAQPEPEAPVVIEASERRV